MPPQNGLVSGWIRIELADDCTYCREAQNTAIRTGRGPVRSRCLSCWRYVRQTAAGQLDLVLCEQHKAVVLVEELAVCR